MEKRKNELIQEYNNLQSELAKTQIELINFNSLDEDRRMYLCEKRMCLISSIKGVSSELLYVSKQIFNSLLDENH